MTKTMKFAFGAALGVLMLAGAPTSAFAQNDPSQTNIASLEFQSTDVREALRALFKNVGVSYTIAPDVQGTITVSLKNVPFETALQNITRQVEATYRIEGGVYQIVRREDPTPTGTTTDNGVGTLAPNRNVRRKIKIRYADPQFIAILLGTDKGSQNYGLAPEISTIQNTPQSQGGGLGGGLGGGGGFGGGMGGGMGGGFGGGMGGGFGGGMGGFGGGGMGGFGGGGGSFGGGGGGFGR